MNWKMRAQDIVGGGMKAGQESIFPGFTSSHSFFPGQIIVFGPSISLPGIVQLHRNQVLGHCRVHAGAGYSSAGSVNRKPGEKIVFGASCWDLTGANDKLQVDGRGKRGDSGIFVLEENPWDPSLRCTQDAYDVQLIMLNSGFPPPSGGDLVSEAYLKGKEDCLWYGQTPKYMQNNARNMEGERPFITSLMEWWGEWNGIMYEYLYG